MSEKLKLAIRLSADPKAAVKAFAELKKKSRDTWRALEQTQEELKALRAHIKASGGQDIRLAAQFEMARNKARGFWKSPARASQKPWPMCPPPGRRCARIGGTAALTQSRQSEPAGQSRCL